MYAGSSEDADCSEDADAEELLATAEMVLEHYGEVVRDVHTNFNLMANLGDLLGFVADQLA